jgi:hypothetical protein
LDEHFHQEDGRLRAAAAAGAPRAGWVAWRGLALAACVATLATLLFVAANDLVPRESPRSFASAFLLYALPFYALLLAGPILVAWIAARLLGPPWLPRAVVFVLAVAALVAAVGLNGASALRLPGLEGPPGFRVLALLALALALLGLLACAALRLERWVAPTLLGLLAPLLAGAAFVAEPPQAPRVAAVAPQASDGPARAGDEPRRAGRPALVFVGVDGADWKLMAPLLERGELPTIAALRARGATGDLATLRPTHSPALWTTMVTGRSPRKHGILGFTSLRMAGVAGALGRTRAPRGLLFDRLYAALEDQGLIAEGPVVSSARRVPALWEIATAHGSPLSVVNLWATWPAEPILGALVSERIYSFRQAARAGDRPEEGQLTWPPELHDEIRLLIMDPQAVSYEDSRPFMDVTPEEFALMRSASVHDKTVEGEFKYLYSMFETERRAALHLVERSRRRAGEPADLLVLFRIVDIACHRALDASELVDDHLSASAEERRKFGRVVSEAYRRVDRALAQILASYRDPNVVLVSDHGFGPETQRGQKVYQHNGAPPGVFLAAGPAFRPGPVKGLTILDVMPLLAVLEGLPVADDLEGRLREDLLLPSFLAARPPRRVATYGPRGRVVVAKDVAAADEELVERLRALGYVQ